MLNACVAHVQPSHSAAVFGFVLWALEACWLRDRRFEVQGAGFRAYNIGYRFLCRFCKLRLPAHMGLGTTRNTLWALYSPSSKDADSLLWGAPMSSAFRI